MDEVMRMMHSLSSWLFTMALEGSAIHSHFRAEHVHNRVRVDDGRGGELRIRLIDLGQHNLVGLMGIFRAYTTGFCLAVFDDVLQHTFVDRFSQTDQDLANACKSGYMLRSAYAHDPITPTWEVRSQVFQGSLDVAPIEWHLNTTDLHGTRVLPSQFGGWVKLVQLLRYCVRTVADTRGLSLEDSFIDLSGDETGTSHTVTIEFRPSDQPPNVFRPL